MRGASTLHQPEKAAAVLKSSTFGRGFGYLLRVLSRPVRRARGRGGVILQPYRGYGSHDRAFMIGRVFRQRSMTPARGAWDVRRQLRDALRRLVRRSVAGVIVRGRALGAEAEAVTDDDGYFRLEWRPPDAPPSDQRWHPVGLSVRGEAGAEATSQIYVPPPSARFAVISDIDDTVMHTGVARKIGMMWRLFFRRAESRTAFPGVAALYRALHAGASGDDGNPMLYVSRAPWGLYEVLDEFFRRHDIPVGPVLFLREWGVSWRSPLPRRAEEHKRLLIDAIMDLYCDLPFVLIGDSGQHDPEIYREALKRHPGRVIAIYVRDVTPRDARIRSEIHAMKDAVRAGGADLVLAEETVLMAEHAEALGLIAPGTVGLVRERQPE